MGESPNSEWICSHEFTYDGEGTHAELGDLKLTESDHAVATDVKLLQRMTFLNSEGAPDETVSRVFGVLCCGQRQSSEGEASVLGIFIPTAGMNLKSSRYWDYEANAKKRLEFGTPITFELDPERPLRFPRPLRVPNHAPVWRCCTRQRLRRRGGRVPPPHANVHSNSRWSRRFGRRFWPDGVFPVTA